MKQEQYRQEEMIAIHYLNQTLELSLESGSLQQELKDGVLLCNLVNKLKPGTIKHVGQKDLSFIKMDNITRFLQGARQRRDRERKRIGELKENKKKVKRRGKGGN
ncbi:hypothetical protein K501DRAFT_176 [Backusella circina FSU 941]|nr:hypothetical protein K501DRAFT_176 [Backusella circina FSU 941]